MGASGPPRTLQLVILPLKMSAIWLEERAVTGLLGWTTRAMPSRAARWSQAPFSISDSFSSRLDRPMSHAPDRAASIPAPEPVPEKFTVTPGSFSRNPSWSAAMTSAMEVEPSVLTVPRRPPDSGPAGRQPVRRNAARRIDSKNFFIQLPPFADIVCRLLPRPMQMQRQ